MNHLNARHTLQNKIVLSMRLFTGISLSQQVSDRLMALMDQLRPFAKIYWTPVGNLHITSKFIGSWPDDRLHGLEDALARVPKTGSIKIAVSQFGFLPNPHRPSAFVAGVQAGPVLTDLARIIGEKLEPLGCPPETRPYKPHITLARVKPDHDIRGLREQIARMTEFDFGTFEATEFHLYVSKPGTRGSEYSKIATYDLMKEKPAN